MQTLRFQVEICMILTKGTIHPTKPLQLSLRLSWAYGTLYSQKQWDIKWTTILDILFVCFLYYHPHVDVNTHSTLFVAEFGYLTVLDPPCHRCISVHTERGWLCIPSFSFFTSSELSLSIVFNTQKGVTDCWLFFIIHVVKQKCSFFIWCEKNVPTDRMYTL